MDVEFGGLGVGGALCGAACLSKGPCAPRCGVPAVKRPCRSQPPERSSDLKRHSSPLLLQYAYCECNAEGGRVEWGVCVPM